MEAWKFVDDEKRNALSDAFILKHSAELKESGFTILPRMAVCEGVFYLKIYYVDNGSGINRSIGS